MDNAPNNPYLLNAWISNTQDSDKINKKIVIKLNCLYICFLATYVCMCVCVLNDFVLKKLGKYYRLNRFRGFVVMCVTYPNGCHGFTSLIWIDQRWAKCGSLISRWRLLTVHIFHIICTYFSLGSTISWLFTWNSTNIIVEFGSFGCKVCRSMNRSTSHFGRWNNFKYMKIHLLEPCPGPETVCSSVNSVNSSDIIKFFQHHAIVLALYKTDSGKYPMILR